MVKQNGTGQIHVPPVHWHYNIDPPRHRETAWYPVPISARAPGGCSQLSTPLTPLESCCETRCSWDPFSAFFVSGDPWMSPDSTHIHTAPHFGTIRMTTKHQARARLRHRYALSTPCSTTKLDHGTLGFMLPRPLPSDVLQARDSDPGPEQVVTSSLYSTNLRYLLPCF